MKMNKMNKMKNRNKIVRMISAVLLLASLTLVFAACSGDGDGNGETGSKNEKSFAAVYRDTTVTLGADAEGVIPKLGEALSVVDAGACGKLGTLKRYTYNSVIIDVLETESSKTVDYISFLDDLAATDKGIRIGSAKTDVIEKYGEPDVDDGANIRYTEGDFTLKFVISDEKVSKIDLIRTTNNG